MRIHDVAVIGAGPAGSATAAFLAERGVDVVLLERARFPRPKPCAEYLSPEATRVLDRLGLLSRIDAFGPARLTGMRIVGPGGASFTGRFAGSHGLRAYRDYGLALPREVLDALIAEAASERGARLRDGVVADLTAVADDHVDVTVGTGTTRELLRARLVIAADGLNSRVARRLKLSRRRSCRRVALATHASDVAAMTDVGEMHVASFGYVGIASIGHGVTNVAIVADLDRVTPLAPPERWFRKLLGGFAEVSRRMERARLVTPVRAVGPFGRWTTRATTDRIMLAGDAADFHDPFTGEGIYAALHGAELAAAHALSALERGRFGARDLAGYDRARTASFRGKWLFERLVSGAVALPAAFDRIASRVATRQHLADLMIGIAGDFVPVSRLFRPWNVMQLVI
ncbi:MAG: NAD(P)/FAD-dependent oxidoreductase [Gemmatimonadetes bacterium]|nr:NAD(P)/FAD-dependent oxidoreductase [Gemmatimonadota bacterium]